MKRIGLICMALILALGALGVGYASWWDDAEIVQVVETGSLELGVFGEAWLEGDIKDMATVGVTFGAHKFVKDYYPFDFYQSVTVTVGNLYPSIWVMENFYIGLGGTVPVHLDVTVTYVDPAGVYDNMTINWTIFGPDGTTVLASGSDVARAALTAIEAFLDGFQLHGCETITIYLDKHLEQTCPQGATASFTMHVKGTQYNV